MRKRQFKPPLKWIVIGGMAIILLIIIFYFKKFIGL